MDLLGGYASGSEEGEDDHAAFATVDVARCVCALVRCFRALLLSLSVFIGDLNVCLKRQWWIVGA